MDRVHKLILLLALTGVTLLGQIPGPGALSGTVTQQGEPVAEAYVSIHIQTPPLVPGEPVAEFFPFSATARSAADGTFSFPTILAGTYSVCVQVPGSNLINACLWEKDPPTVRVPAGGTANAVVEVAAGYRLQLVVGDPQGLLRRRKFNDNAPLMVGVIGPSKFLQPMAAQGTDVSGWKLELVVPMGQDLQLVAQSPAFLLSGTDGKIADGIPLKQSFRIKKQGIPVVPQLRVVGMRPGREN